MGDHEHGRFCFSWRRCRKLGAHIVEISERLPKYTGAIEGLQTGDYTPAIAFLDEQNPQFDETIGDVVARTRREQRLGVGAMASIQSSPTFIQGHLVNLRHELAALTTANPEV